MHIIIAIIGALAGLFWAFTHFMGAARGGKDAVDEVRGAIRRGQWSRRIDKRLIENLSDPREAAAILLVQTASYDGQLTEKQRLQIVNDMQDMFDIDPETAEGMFSFARMALGEITDAANSLRKIARPIIDICSDTEKKSLLTVMNKTAETEGTPNDQQAHFIQLTQRLLFPV